MNGRGKALIVEGANAPASAAKGTADFDLASLVDLTLAKGIAIEVDF